MKKLVWMIGLLLMLVTLASCQGQAQSTPEASKASTPSTPTAVKAAATAAAPTATAAPKINTGGTLRMGMQGESSSLDPHAANQGTGGLMVMPVIYNTLMGLDKDSKVIPRLALSWEMKDKTVTLKLRQGVKFHDNTEFNAAAVKFNLERLADPAMKARFATDIADISSIDVVDNYTVKLNLKAPSAPLLTALAEAAGMMVSPTAAKQLGSDYGRKPVGTGPFKLTEWVLDDRTTVKKFEGYWDKDAAGNTLPYIDSIIFRPIPDEVVKLTGLRAGQMEVIDTVPPQDVDRIKNEKGLVYAVTEGFEFYHFTMNGAEEPFSNKATRQALAWAMDRKAILQGILFGRGFVPNGLFSASNWAYDSSITGFQMDLNKAKEKLTEAGKASGFKFDINVIARPTEVQLATALQAQFAKAGITMNTVSMDSTEFLRRMAAGEFQSYLTFQAGAADPSGDIYTQFHSKSSTNRAKYKNAEVDKLLDDAKAEYDQAARKRLYSQIQKILVEDVPQIRLAFRESGFHIRDAVQNYTHIPTRFERTAMFDRVWLKQ